MTNIVVNSPHHQHHLLWCGEDHPNDELWASAQDLGTNHLQRLRRLFNRIQELRPDFIHAHSSWAGVYARTLPLGTTRVIYQPHCYAFEDPTKPSLARRLYRCAERLLAMRTYKVAVVSKREFVLAANMVGASNTTLVPNVSSIKHPLTSRSRTKGHKLLTVGMVGRICHQKDPLFFAAVASKVLETNSRFQFRWIGDGDSDDLRQALRRSGVDIRGWKEGEKLLKEFEGLDVYFHSACYEGFPLSIVEAAEQGLPIIVRDIAAFQNMPLKSTTGIDDAVSSIVSLATSQKALNHLLEISQSIAADHSEDKQRSSLMELYLTSKHRN